ncbi:hypothetical protein BaRGS_00023251, partial [Batillaria attramentaria]
MAHLRPQLVTTMEDNFDRTTTKEYTGYDKDVLLGGVYIPPEGSRYSTIDLFDELENSLVDNVHRLDPYILLAGDFNAYTKLSDDFIDADDLMHDNVPGVEEYIVDSTFIPPKRHSQDQHRPNNYGYRLLELCKAHSVYIFNGRVGHDAKVGALTSNSSSVVDYYIGSSHLLSLVEDLFIAPFDAMLSDVHNALCLTLKTLTNNDATQDDAPEDRVQTVSQVAVGARVRRWDPTKGQVFKDGLAERGTDHIHTMLDNGADINLINTEVVNTLLEVASDTLGTVSRTANADTRRRRRQAWFNDACRKKRLEYLRAKAKCKRNDTPDTRDELRIKNHSLNELNAPITEEEVLTAIKTTKNGKAAGIDEIYNEYLKNSVPVMTSVYCRLFNKALDESVVPEDWVTGLIKPLYKGKGDRHDCDNYR